MGLDFSHCDARWAYSGFNRFRSKLSASIGLEWFNDIFQDPEADAKWERISRHSDPLVPLLIHSDCDGKLTAEECRAIAPRLREVLSEWPEDDFDRITGLKLADGMDEAAKTNESLEFS